MAITISIAIIHIICDLNTVHEQMLTNRSRANNLNNTSLTC